MIARNLPWKSRRGSESAHTLSGKHRRKHESVNGGASNSNGQHGFSTATASPRSTRMAALAADDQDDHTEVTVSASLQEIRQMQGQSVCILTGILLLLVSGACICVEEVYNVSLTVDFPLHFESSRAPIRAIKWPDSK